MRRAKPIEAFDPTTLWPVQVFPSSLAVAAAGHKRASVNRAIRQNVKYKLRVPERIYTHHELGWRCADGASRLPEYLAEHTRHDLSAPTSDFHEVEKLIEDFHRWVGGPIDGWRCREMLERRYGLLNAGKRRRVRRVGPGYDQEELHDSLVVAGLILLPACSAVVTES